MSDETNEITLDTEEHSTEIKASQDQELSYLQGYENDEALIQALKNGEASFERGEDPDAYPGDQKSEDADDEERDEDEEESFEVGGEDLSAFDAEFQETGWLSEDSFTELEELGWPRGVVEQYLSSFEASQSEQDRRVVKESVGSEAALDATLQWAEDNLSDEDKAELAEVLASSDPEYQIQALAEIQSYHDAELVENVLGSEEELDALIDWVGAEANDADKANFALALESGIPHYQTLALQMAKASMDNSMSDAKMVRGNSARTREAPFRSMSEQVKAVQNERYGVDPDYTNWVQSKMLLPS